jgi:ABC-type multidrug transport system fused ATPase/permease subunit
MLDVGQNTEPEENRSMISNFRIRVGYFFQQMRNYLSSIASFIKQLYLYSPKMMIKLLALSIAGTSLQGFSLGTTFFILKHMDSHLLVKIPKLHVIYPYKVHASLLLTGVLLLLGAAVYIIYLTEKTCIEYSKGFATRSAGKMFERFPSVTSRLRDPSIHPKTGIPSALSSEISSQSMKLDMASRRLLKSPLAFFQLLYGIGFLLYLEPWLTFILALISLPLLIPLRHLTVSVRRFERLRRDASKGKGGEVASLAEESSKLLYGPEKFNEDFQKKFEDSGVAASTKYRAARRLAVAGSRAVATAAMVFNGIATMIYFWLFYDGQKEQVALIVVYFGALRMSIMSGRQLIARLSNFARFYSKVQAFIADEGMAALLKEMPATPRVPGIEGTDLAGTGEETIMVEGKGPFAVIGPFPFKVVNRYAPALALKSMNARKNSAVIAHMGVIIDDLGFDLKTTWRELLGVEAEDPALPEKLHPFCNALDPDELAEILDVFVEESAAKDGAQKAMMIEALFLRAYFSNAPFIAIKESALLELGEEAANSWIQLLNDRLLYIYHQYDGQVIGKWGEEYAALVGRDAKRLIGVAPVAWVNENQDKVRELLEKGPDAADANDDELEWDDDDDDDDD